MSDLYFKMLRSFSIYFVYIPIFVVVYFQMKYGLSCTFATASSCISSTGKTAAVPCHMAIVVTATAEDDDNYNAVTVPTPVLRLTTNFSSSSSTSDAWLTIQASLLDL